MSIDDKKFNTYAKAGGWQIHGTHVRGVAREKILKVRNKLKHFYYIYTYYIGSGNGYFIASKKKKVIGT